MTAALPAADEVLLDAFDGERDVTGRVKDAYSGWTIAPPSIPVGDNLVPSPPDPTNPSDARIGWGLILPSRPGAPREAEATAADAPKAVQRLLAHRKGKVLRYQRGAVESDFLLYDPIADRDIPLLSPPYGVGPEQLPKYLLIYGSPAEIPWAVQFYLNPIRCVGRLDLTGAALTRYVRAIVADWSGSAASYASPVVWSVDQTVDVERDMTTLMRVTVAAPIVVELRDDDDMPDVTYLDGSEQPATVAGLTGALAAKQPALVVTTSHGLTAPLDDPAKLRSQLGTPVDQSRKALDAKALLRRWQPDGAVWFAQACCSAGGNGPSVYQGLFPLNGEVGEVLFGVAAHGPSTAPLPRALLGARKPLRAFIGRVEPTFSWTLRDQLTGAAVTADLTESVYTRLCGGLPVGMAMEEFFDPISTILRQYLDATTLYNNKADAVGAAAAKRALYLKVTSYDRSGLVILGDPAVRIPLPAKP